MNTVLITDKGNFFARKNDFFGFFNENGQLLREASVREWDWAGSVMENVSTDIIFDFSSIIEGRRRKEENDLRTLISFIGRDKAERIMKFFDKKPGDFQIDGQMPPDWERSAVSTGGCAYSHREWIKAWSVGDQIVEMKQKTIRENADRNANGSSVDACGFNADYLARESSDDFFVINWGHRYITDHGHNTDYSESNDWFLFKRPKMEPIWAEWREMANKKLVDFFIGIKPVINR